MKFYNYLNEAKTVDEIIDNWVARSLAERTEFKKSWFLKLYREYPEYKYSGFAYRLFFIQDFDFKDYYDWQSPNKEVIARNLEEPEETVVDRIVSENDLDTIEEIVEFIDKIGILRKNGLKSFKKDLKNKIKDMHGGYVSWTETLTALENFQNIVGRDMTSIPPQMEEQLPDFFPVIIKQRVNGIRLWELINEESNVRNRVKEELKEIKEIIAPLESNFKIIGSEYFSDEGGLSGLELVLPQELFIVNGKIYEGEI